MIEWFFNSLLFPSLWYSCLIQIFCSMWFFLKGWIRPIFLPPLQSVPYGWVQIKIPVMYGIPGRDHKVWDQKLNEGLMEPRRNPGGTQMVPRQNPGRTQMVPRQNPGGIQAEPRRNPGGTQAEPRRNPGGTQAEPRQNPDGIQTEPRRNPDGIQDLKITVCWKFLC